MHKHWGFYTCTIPFEERELKSYAEPVTRICSRKERFIFLSSLQARTSDSNYGNMGFSPVENSIPKMRRAISTFRILESYRQGIRYASATSENAHFQLATEKSVNHIFEYERALDQLMLCSLRRRKSSG